MIFVFDPMAVLFVISYNVTLTPLPNVKSKSKYTTIDRSEKTVEDLPDIDDSDDVSEKQIGRGGVVGK